MTDYIKREDAADEDYKELLFLQSFNQIKEACFIADKLWAFFAGMARESAEADELLKDADWLREFIRENMRKMRSSDYCSCVERS